MEASFARAARLCVLVALAATLSACGGGGSGGDGGGGTSGSGSGGTTGTSTGGSSGGSTGDTTGGSTGGTTGTSTGGTSGGGSSGGSGGTPPPTLNNGLSGKLYFQDAATGGNSSYHELDLATGVLTTLRIDTSGTVPSNDATLFATWENDPVDDPQDLDHDELDLFQPDGRTVARFVKAGSLGGAYKISPDKTKVIASYYTDNDSTIYIPTVFDLTSNPIGKALASFRDYTAWEWLPDGRLLLAKGDSIYIVPGDLSAPQLLKQFPNDTPAFLSASPDGTQLAFDLGDAGVLKNHVWLMNIDGSNARQLTTSGLNEDGATWSPDGKYIAVRQGISYTFGGPPVPGGCPVVYILPADAQGPVNLDADPPAPAFQAQELEDGKPRDVCAFSAPAWRAAQPDLPRTPGTGASGGGLNSGLSGRLVYDGAPDIVSLDLASGTVTTLVADPGADFTAPYASFDGTELSYIQSSPDSGNLDDDQINIIKTDGTVVKKIETPDYLSGYAKLSPDSSLLAVELDPDPTSCNNCRSSLISLRIADSTVVAAPGEFDSWSWLKNGSLALALNNALYLTDTAQQNPALQYTFSDTIGSIQVSPDNTRIAFAMLGHVWTAGTDGSNLKQLTVSSDLEGTPQWSPDGKFVLVQLGGDCPALYAVPADGERVFVGNPAVQSTALMIRQIENGQPRNVCAFSQVSWH
jgi:Tol biopolymer transport system component